MVKVIPASRQTHVHTRVNDASRILKRFYVVERQLMRTLGVWFIETSQWDLKRVLAEDMWQTSRHADVLRTRVLELRYPRRDVEKKFDPDVMSFMAEAAKAANFQEFIAGIYDVLLPELVREYTAYLERADPLDDAPTVYQVRHILMDKQAQIDRMRKKVKEVLPTEAESLHFWRDYLRKFLASIGGFTGLEEKGPKPEDHACAGRPVHQIPLTVQRDPRWRPALFHLPHENKYDVEGREAWKRFEGLDKRVAMQVWSAISHFNEIWAAEMPCSVMWQLDNEPWDFYLDLARWAYDETRHSTMGYRAMEGWGWDIPDLIPWGNALYNAMAPMPPIQRLSLLHFYEEGLMRAGTKQVELKILESAQDDGSVQDMDYDWADEAIHVSYGYTWLKHLLGDDKAGQTELKRLTDEAREIMAEFVRAHKDEPTAQLKPYFDRLYDVVAGMMRDIPDDGLEISWAPVVADEAVLEDYQ